MHIALIVVAVLAVWLLSLLAKPFGPCWACRGKGVRVKKRGRRSKARKCLAVQGQAPPPAHRIPHRSPCLRCRPRGGCATGGPNSERHMAGFGHLENERPRPRGPGAPGWPSSRRLRRGGRRCRVAAGADPGGSSAAPPWPSPVAGVAAVVALSRPGPAAVRPAHRGGALLAAVTRPGGDPPAAVTSPASQPLITSITTTTRRRTARPAS